IQRDACVLARGEESARAQIGEPRRGGTLAGPNLLTDRARAPFAIGVLPKEQQDLELFDRRDVLGDQFLDFSGELALSHERVLRQTCCVERPRDCQARGVPVSLRAEASSTEPFSARVLRSALPSPCFGAFPTVRTLRAATESRSPIEVRAIARRHRELKPELDRVMLALRGRGRFAPRPTSFPGLAPRESRGMAPRSIKPSGQRNNMNPSDVQHPAQHPERQARRRSLRLANDPVTERLRSLRDALWAARQGDFSLRLPVYETDETILSEVALAFNSLLEQNETLARELDRVARRVGSEGMTSERASLGPSGGAWGAMVDSVNSLIESMALPNMAVTRLLEQVADGDLSREMPIHLDGRPLRGEFLRMGATVNRVIASLRRVNSGVSKVVRELASEGRMGIQASVEGLSGTWRDLCEDVNLLSATLTDQVRNIALVSRAIANGDLSQKITVETRGEILELK